MSSTNFEKECESRIRSIIKDLVRQGIDVRREKLTRGPSFKVNSGLCNLAGKVTVFVDKRLPVEAQLQTLEEHRTGL